MNGPRAVAPLAEESAEQAFGNDADADAAAVRAAVRPWREAPALRCRGLVKSYGDVQAVAGVDLDIRRGECFGMLGPNGAGKSTTLEIFEGLLAPDAGEVEVLGSRWSGDGRALRARLGVQLQETRFEDHQRVCEVVALFRSFYTTGFGVADTLALVDLEEKASAYVRTLSGGQKQRLSLACAIVSDPELLILDEPTTGLDPQSRQLTWDIVDDFKERGRTVLLTTHYMEEAARLCDRVAIIDHGRLVAQGTPRELIASLDADHVVEFSVGDGVRMSTELLSRLPSVRRATCDNGTCRLTVREVHHAVPALLATLGATGVQPTVLTIHHATLDDVFLSLTGRSLRHA